MGRYCAMARKGTIQIEPVNPISFVNLSFIGTPYRIEFTAATPGQVHLLFWDGENPEQMLIDEYVQTAGGNDFYEFENVLSEGHVYQASAQRSGFAAVLSDPLAFTG